MVLRHRNVHRLYSQRIKESEDDFSEEAFAEGIEEELIRQLYIHMEEMPEKQRQIIELSIKGLKKEEIAQTMDVSINTVKTQKRRAFAYLRKSMGDLTCLVIALHAVC